MSKYRINYGNGQVSKTFDTVAKARHEITDARARGELYSSRYKIEGYMGYGEWATVRAKNPIPQVLLVERRAGKVIVQRVKNPLDLMTALNVAGDLAMMGEYVGEQRHGSFTKQKTRRKNPFGEGVCPPHLKKFRFRKVR